MTALWGLTCAHYAINHAELFCKGIHTLRRVRAHGGQACSTHQFHGLIQHQIHELIKPTQRAVDCSVAIQFDWASTAGE
jgi:hypothetical protein